MADCRFVRVVVTNPGGQRHLREVAYAFAETGDLERYVSSFGFSGAEIERIAARLPSGLSGRIEGELRRREVADEVAAVGNRVTRGWAGANILLSRAPLPRAAADRADVARIRGVRPGRRAPTLCPDLSGHRLPRVQR